MASDPAAFISEIESNAERIETPCGDGTMVWRKWGSGRPLFLFHGGPGAWTHWIRNVVPLSAARAVIAADMPGFGDSALPAVPDDFPSIVGTLALGMERIAPSGEPFDVLAFSFGGAVASMVCASFGARVERLILVGCGGFGPTQRTREYANWQKAAGEEGRIAAHRHNLAVQMFADPSRIDDVAISIQAQTTVASRTRARRMMRADQFVQKTFLPEVRAHVHAIWGAHDVTAGKTLDERIEMVHTLRPGSGHSVIPDAGHWVAYEKADVFNALALSLLGPS